MEDEEWKWSPVYLLLRDHFGLSAYLPRPRKHTAEEWHLIQKFIQAISNVCKKIYNHRSIVVTLQSTWKLHFSENITDVDLNTLSQRLEHVSQEKEFVSNLSRVQGLMRIQLDYMWRSSGCNQVLDLGKPSSRKEQLLANDIAFFKAPSETPGHQDVMKRVCKYLSDIAGHAMVMHPDDLENFKDMWIRGCPRNEQEMLIKKWKSRLFNSYEGLYANDIVALS
jgi:hypothetical protein